MSLIPQASAMAPLIGQRIHGWLAPLVDDRTLRDVALANERALANNSETDLLDRIEALLTGKSMTAKEIAAELRIREKAAKNALWKLGKVNRIEGEFAPRVGKRSCKVYRAMGT